MEGAKLVYITENSEFWTNYAIYPGTLPGTGEKPFFPG